MDDLQNQAYNAQKMMSARDEVFDDAQNEKQRIQAGTEALKKELMEKWKKDNAGAEVFPPAVGALSGALVQFLLSWEIANAYDALAKKNSLSGEQRTKLAQTVWNIAIRNDWANAQHLVQESLGMQSDSFLGLYGELSVSILGNAKSLSLQRGAAREVARPEQSQNRQVQTTLEKALQEYPRIALQMIGTTMLKMRYSPNPVNPSVKNWIADYHDVLGGGKHTTLERSQYLFQSPNGKSLDSTMRKKLTQLFQSLDEGILLNIDPENQKILFPIFASAPMAESISSAPGQSHSIAPSPTNGSLHNFASHSEKAVPSVSLQSPMVPQPDVSHESGEAGYGGWDLAKNMVETRSADNLKKFAPQGLGVKSGLDQADIEAKILAKDSGIGSEEYFQKKNEDDAYISGGSIRQMAISESGPSGGGLRFNNPQNPFVRKDFPAAAPGISVIRQDIPVSGAQQPTQSAGNDRFAKRESVPETNRGTRGSIVDLTQ